MLNELSEESKIYWVCSYLNQKFKEGNKQNVDNNDYNPWEQKNKLHIPYVYVSEYDFLDFCSSSPDISGKIDFIEVLSLMGNKGIIDLPDFGSYPISSFDFESAGQIVNQQRIREIHLYPPFFEFIKEHHIKYKASYATNNSNISMDSDSPIAINFDNQTIKIGNRYFENFRNLFDILGIKKKTTQSQKKGGVSLIYSLARYGQENKDAKNMAISDLINCYNEFKTKWDKWIFAKKGIKKTTFTKTDCDSANTILRRCGLKIRLDLDKKDKKIFIKK